MEVQTSDVVLAVTSPPFQQVPSGPAKSMNALEVIDCFIALDQDKDGKINNVEFIQGLKSNWQIAQKFGLEQNMVLDDVPREKYDLVFGQIDNDHSKSVDVS